MRKFKGEVRLGLVGCVIRFEFELPDDATEEEIDNATHHAAMAYVDYWSEEVADE